MIFLRLISPFKLLLFLFFYSATTLGGDFKVIIASDVWCPNNCSASDHEYQGFSIDLIRSALRNQGWESEYINASFSRSKEYVIENRWHVLPGVDSFGSPYLEMTREPVAYYRFVFLVRSDSEWKYTTPESLNLIKLGAVGGYSYSPEIKTHIKKNYRTDKIDLLHSSDAVTQNLKKLASGRIDAFIDDENVINFWISKLGLQDKFKMAGVAYEAPAFCGLENNFSEVLRPVIDNGIIELKKDGTFRKLLSKYNIRNWPFDEKIN